MKKFPLLVVLACFFGLTAILTTLFIRSAQQGGKESKTELQDTTEYYFPQYPANGTFWECQIEMGFIN